MQAGTSAPAPAAQNTGQQRHDHRAGTLVLSAGQQFAGLPGDFPADSMHEEPDARDLGTQPVIVTTQPVAS
jgi:hypothetical protein